MKYSKPGITFLGSAVVAVQIMEKEPEGTVDLNNLKFTSNAYQADE